MTGRPDSSVVFARSPRYSTVRMTEGYLNTRMNRYNTISCNQNYVSKVMSNPRTSYRNRQAVIVYVLSHPEKFIPFCESTDDPVFNDWAMHRNAGADTGFLARFRRLYCRVSS